jgi:hypothetical protein
VPISLNVKPRGAVLEILASLSCSRAAAATMHETTSSSAAHGLRSCAIGAPLRLAAQELAEPNLRRARSPSLSLFSAASPEGSELEQQQQQRGGCFPELEKRCFSSQAVGVPRLMRGQKHPVACRVGLTAAGARLSCWPSLDRQSWSYFRKCSR